MASKLVEEIRVFCPEHGRVFHTSAKSQILCPVTGHLLAGNFPRGEAWEFCCDCHTFFPGKLGQGENAKKDCLVCGRQIERWYHCHSCSTLSFESNEPPEEKLAANIDFEKGIVPFCEACRTPSVDLFPQKHNCEKIKVELVTARENCFFCRKKLPETITEKVSRLEIPRKKKAIEKASPLAEISLITCPNPACARPIPANKPFCGFCGIVIIPNEGFNESKSRLEAKTLLLGTFCPNCNWINGSENKFCNQCGQALKSALPAVLETKPPEEPESQPTVFPNSEIAEQELSEKKTNKSHPMAVIGCVGIILFLGIGLAFIMGNVLFSSSPVANINSAEQNLNRNSGSNNLKTSSRNNQVIQTTPYPTENTNKPTNVKPTPDSAKNSSERNFDRTYLGAINYDNKIEIRLIRDGDNLSGEIIPQNRYSTQITVKGTIDDEGSFEMSEYDDQKNVTGFYKGYLYSNGKIEGTWSKPDGSKERPFSLTRK